MRNLRDKTLFDRIYYKAEDNLYINGKTGHIGWYQCRECGKITSNLSDFVAHSGGTATCTERAICEVCGASYGDYAHVFKDIEPKAPTCYEKGWKDGKTCINCGYTTCTYIDKRYHAMSISTTQAPTCTEKGWKESHCLYEECDYVYRADIPALEHACVQTGMKESVHLNRERQERLRYLQELRLHDLHGNPCIRAQLHRHNHEADLHEGRIHDSRLHAVQ